MKKSRTGMLLIGLTALALSAGVVAGMLAARLPAAPATDGPTLPPPPAFERSIADELALNSDQREKMRQIWEGVRGNVHRTFDEAQKLQDKRDNELFALMSDDQKKEAAKVSQKYAKLYGDLTHERDRLFDDAVAQTNSILTPEQQKKYAEIRKNLHRPSTQPIPADATQAVK